MIKTFLRLIVLSLLTASCGENDNTNKMNTTTDQNKISVTKKEWGETEGKKVYLYTLTNNKGDSLTVTNYGGTLVSWSSKDKNGTYASVLAGPADLKGFLDEPPYFGALIGRYGNRIGGASFLLDGKTYRLPANDGQNTLHGGLKGFDKVVWDVEVTDSIRPSLSLTYLSPSGDQGFPGNLEVQVVYTLTDDNEIRIDYTARTDSATPVNLTNHAYFNLTGDAGQSILDHILMIDADKYTPVNKQLIPTGKTDPVESTPFDFRKPTAIGSRINQVTGGYDHNWVLNRKDSSLKKIAELHDPVSGRKLEVSTTEPGIQFYSGNFLDGKFQTASGKVINKHGALCLETQHYPDSPNQASFPSTILRPGETYRSQTVYKLSVL